MPTTNSPSNTLPLESRIRQALMGSWGSLETLSTSDKERRVNMAMHWYQKFGKLRFAKLSPGRTPEDPSLESPAPPPNPEPGLPPEA